MIDLTTSFNNVGITRAHPDGGEFNIWGNSFPAEQLPAPGRVTEVAGVPFRFPGTRPDLADNIRCRGQRLRLPAGSYDWLYLLAAAERRSEDAVWLRYRDRGRSRQWLRVSDFWPQTPSRFGERLAFRSTWMRYPRHDQRDMAPAIWLCRVPVTRPGVVVGLDLPDHPAIHIFALTGVSDVATAAAGAPG